MSRVPKPYKPYSQREEWSDLTPIPQDEEGFVPLAPIMYSAEYKDTIDHFRAIVRKEERSERVLEITEHIIRLNPSHYSVWQYRYDTLLAIKADLAAELELMDEIATIFLKTYQVWHHRRLLLGHVRTPRPELMFIANNLQEDTKNYHTWAYRQWILSEFNHDDLWSGELAFIEGMLQEDLRNNSAWHHRFFVVWEAGVRAGDEDRDAVLKRELAYIKNKISIAPNNPSAWNYLRGTLEHTSTPFSTLETFIAPYAVPHSESPSPSAPSTTEVVNEIDTVVDLENPKPSAKASLPCVQAIEFLADIWEEKAAAVKSSELDAQSVELVKSNVKEALNLYATLAAEHDTMRQKYWEFRQREAEKILPISATPAVAAIV